MSDQLNTVVIVLLHALIESAPYLVAGFVLAAILREFVATETISSWFGGRGIKPLLRAAGVGALLPICSCGVIPLGIGAYRAGAARGTTLAFMAATPLISPLSVLLSWSLLGPQITMALVAAALVGAMMIGLVDNYLRGGHDADGTQGPAESLDACCDTNDASCDTPVHDGHADVGMLRRTVRALRWALADFGPQVSVDMFLGLCVAAVMLALVPAGAMSDWVGSGTVLSLLAVVLVALPLYTCTLPTIPIVAGLLALGMGPGACVALLVAGPATNLGEINVMRRQMGGSTALFFVICLIATGVGAGAAVNMIAAAESESTHGAFDASALAEHSGDETVLEMLSEIAVWQWPFLIVIGCVLAVGLVGRAAKLPEKFRKRGSLAAWLFGRT